MCKNVADQVLYISCQSIKLTKFVDLKSCYKGLTTQYDGFDSFDFCPMWKIPKLDLISLLSNTTIIRLWQMPIVMEAGDKGYQVSISPSVSVLWGTGWGCYAVSSRKRNCPYDWWWGTSKPQSTWLEWTGHDQRSEAAGKTIGEMLCLCMFVFIRLLHLFDGFIIKCLLQCNYIVHEVILVVPKWCLMFSINQ